eukprot:COSAG02_NODE_10631_length_1894_cov_1.877994_1_plen_535_part_01
MAAAIASSYVPPSSMTSPYEPPEAPSPPDSKDLRPRARVGRADQGSVPPAGRSRATSTTNARRRLLAVARDAVVQAADAEDEAEQALAQATTAEEQQAARILQAEAEAMARDAEYLMRKAEAKMQRRTERSSPPAFSPSPPTVREDAPPPSRGPDISVRSDDAQQSSSGRLHSLTGSTPRRTVSGAPLQPISVNISTSSRDSRQTINLSACSRASRECVNVSSLSATRAREVKVRSARTVLHPSQENVGHFEVQGRSVGSDSSLNSSRSTNGATAPSSRRNQARVPTPPEPRTAPREPAPRKATANNSTVLEGLLAMMSNVLEKSDMTPAELARKAGVASADHNINCKQLRELLETLGVNADTAVLVELLESLDIEQGSISLPTLILKISKNTSNDEAASTEEWQCSLCTKTNAPADSACVVCKRERGHVATARPTRRVLRHEAAVKMQSSYRGYATRKVLRVELDLSGKSTASVVASGGGANPDVVASDPDVSDELHAAVERLEKQIPDSDKIPLDDMDDMDEDEGYVQRADYD